MITKIVGIGVLCYSLFLLYFIVSDVWPKIFREKPSSVGLIALNRFKIYINQNQIKSFFSHTLYWIGLALFAISLIQPAIRATSGLNRTDTYYGYEAALYAIVIFPMIFGALKPWEWLYIGLPLANPFILFSRLIFRTKSVKLIKRVLLYYCLLAVGSPFLLSDIISEVFIGYYLWTLSIITISLSYFIRDSGSIASLSVAKFDE